jgi:hypothetical protein
MFLLVEVTVMLILKAFSKSIPSLEVIIFRRKVVNYSCTTCSGCISVQVSLIRADRLRGIWWSEKVETKQAAVFLLTNSCNFESTQTHLQIQPLKIPLIRPHYNDVSLTDAFNQRCFSVWRMGCIVIAACYSYFCAFCLHTIRWECRHVVTWTLVQ